MSGSSPVRSSSRGRRSRRGATRLTAGSTPAISATSTTRGSSPARRGPPPERPPAAGWWGPPGPDHPAPEAARAAVCSIRRLMPSDEVLYDKDADLSVLDGKTVAILGYGSQGHAHALNLKDSGVKVVVGLRPDSSSRDDAAGEGLEVMDVADAASAGDVVRILLPDEN